MSLSPSSTAALPLPDFVYPENAEDPVNEMYKGNGTPSSEPIPNMQTYPVPLSPDFSVSSPILLREPPRHVSDPHAEPLICKSSVSPTYLLAQSYLPIVASFYGIRVYQPPLRSPSELRRFRFPSLPPIATLEDCAESSPGLLREQPTPSSPEAECSRSRFTSIPPIEKLEGLD